MSIVIKETHYSPRMVYCENWRGFHTHVFTFGTSIKMAFYVADTHEYQPEW